jgi:hypothetical protein
LVAKKHVPGIAFAMIWPVLAAADEGRPVTAADLSGKTICWNGKGGLVVTYHADGRTSSKRGGHSVWSVPKPGLVKFRYRYTPMFVLPDGRFQTHRFFGKSGDRSPAQTFTLTIGEPSAISPEI